MDILSILREAKNPEKKTLVQVKQEDTKEAEDYSSDVEEPVAEEETPDEEETTEEETPDEDTEEETDDTPEDNDSTEDDTDEGNDYTEDADTDMGADDDTGDEDTSEDDTTSDESAEEEPEDEYKDQNRVLMNDMVYLYNGLEANITKLDSMEFLDILTCKIIIEAKKNLTDLMEYLFTYITEIFNTKSYADNLYTYKYIIQLYKITLNMLSKLPSFNGNA